MKVRGEYNRGLVNQIGLLVGELSIMERISNIRVVLA